MKIPILLSTDIGSDIDDALTLLIMLRHPEIDLRAVYTVNGDLASRCFIAQEMMRLAGVSTPVCCGIAEPLGALVKPYSHFEDCLVEDRYLDEEEIRFDPSRLHFKLFKETGIIEDGIAHMATQLAREPHIVFSIAPLTNIAVLIRDYPEVVPNITRLYVMGFRTGDGLEHNVRFDPVAAKQVLESSIPLTIIPGDLCSRFKMTFAPEYELGGSLGAYVTSMLRAFVGAKIVGECRASRLLEILEQSRIGNDVILKIGVKRYNEVTGFKQSILANCDEYAAYLERDDFLEKLQRLADQLDEKELCYQYGSYLAEQLRALFVRQVSVADVYIPYCFLNQDRLRIEQYEIVCDIFGASCMEHGGHHQVITDLDFAHFKEFLNQYLR